MSKKDKVIKSFVPGAVFIHRDTSKFESRCVYITPGLIGIKKYDGCVEFGPANSTHTSRYHRKKGQSKNTIFALTPYMCNKIFFDVPAKEEVWLVTPKGKDYLWVNVTDKIKVSKH